MMKLRKPQSGKSKQSTSEKKRRVYQVTRKEVFLWIGVAFLALVWMFTLGVIVGRGLSPVRFDVEKLKKEFIALKEEALKRELDAKKTFADLASGQRNLGFYDVLTDKKEEARLKSLAKPQKQPVKLKTQETPLTKGTPDKPDPSIERKRTVAKNEQNAVSPSLPEEVSSDSSFTLQVASLKDLSKAEKMVSLLKKKGYGAYAVTARVSGKGIYHRVRVGHFNSPDDAKATASRLRAEDLEPIVMRK